MDFAASLDSPNFEAGIRQLHNVQKQCLGGLTSVTFNGTDGIITSDSETTVVADVPSGSTTGPLAVVGECCEVSFSKNLKVK